MHVDEISSNRLLHLLLNSFCCVLFKELLEELVETDGVTSHQPIS